MTRWLVILLAVLLATGCELYGYDARPGLPAPAPTSTPKK